MATAAPAALPSATKVFSAACTAAHRGVSAGGEEARLPERVKGSIVAVASAPRHSRRVNTILWVIPLPPECWCEPEGSSVAGAKTMNGGWHVPEMFVTPQSSSYPLVSNDQTFCDPFR